MISLTNGFKQLNKRLEKFDSEIINCRVTSEQISRYKTDISYTVFLRYFVADFVKEDKALYLDCDLVVTKNLDDLFETDLQDYPLAAIRDYGGKVYYGREIFNAGVLFINNRVWKQEQMTQRLIDLTNEWHDKVDQADQSILNMLLKSVLELDLIITTLLFMNDLQTIVSQKGRTILGLSIIYQKENLGRYTLDKPTVMFGGTIIILNGQSWDKIIIYMPCKTPYLSDQSSLYLFDLHRIRSD